MSDKKEKEKNEDTRRINVKIEQWSTDNNVPGVIIIADERIVFPRAADFFQSEEINSLMIRLQNKITCQSSITRPKSTPAKR